MRIMQTSLTKYCYIHSPHLVAFIYPIACGREMSRHIVSLPNWCLRLCVSDQTVVGLRYFTEPRVL